MISSIRDVIDRSYKEYNPQNRRQWVLGRCGMAALNMDMTFWTKEAEESLIKHGN
jgi:hypothetical protein